MSTTGSTMRSRGTRGHHEGSGIPRKVDQSAASAVSGDPGNSMTASRQKQSKRDE
ncbi:40S ribosomal protein S26, partial [Ascosphaera pollenicola]